MDTNVYARTKIISHRTTPKMVLFTFDNGKIVMGKGNIYGRNDADIEKLFDYANEDDSIPIVDEDKVWVIRRISEYSNEKGYVFTVI